MIVNGTCINDPIYPAAAVLINAWTGVSSLVAVIWLGRHRKNFLNQNFLHWLFAFVTWCLRVLLATLPFMGMNNYGYHIWCDFYWSDTSPEGRFFVVIFLLQGFGCMLFTVFCNVSVIFELLAMNRRVGTRVSFQERLDHFKFMIIMTIVSVAYIGCSAPYLIRLACNQFGYDLSLAKDFNAVRVYLVNNLTNSYFVLFIQALFHPKLVEKFRACCGRMPRNNTSVRGPETMGSVLPV